MPYCKYCGSVVDSDAVFCTECGKRIGATVPPVKEEKQEEYPQRVDAVTVQGGTIAAEDVNKVDEDRVNAYMQRVTRYRVFMCMLNQYYNKKEEWTERDLTSWAGIEELMLKRCELPEISIFRIKEPTRLQPSQTQPEKRRNRSYNKKNTEDWEKLEKKKSE